MLEYRRVTLACAARDWSSASHDDVVSRHKGNHLPQRFLTDTSLDHCYAGANVLDRARDRPRGTPGAGPHVLGNFHVRRPAGLRAWLWRDTGELGLDVGEVQVNWMIAEGPRRHGHPSDLQASHADILYDPNDKWLPVKEDYRVLAMVHDDTWILRASEAVMITVREAEAHRGELIAVDIDKAIASVSQDFGVTVAEEYAERWVIIDRFYTDKQPVDPDTAFALADAAFAGIDDDVQEIFEKTEILDGAYTIDPARVYAWSAIV